MGCPVPMGACQLAIFAESMELYKVDLHISKGMLANYTLDESLVWGFYKAEQCVSGSMTHGFCLPSKPIF